MASDKTDLPFVLDNGTKKWYFKGKLHRKDGPAIEYANGTKGWYKHGQLHREGGPAVEYTNGNSRWYKNGLLHREDGPAAEYEDGTKKWYFNGTLVSPIDFLDKDISEELRRKIILEYVFDE